ncbi:hypothetical protein HUT18_18415 [Streptomyces sp. NA04227]|uniref:hypothetical protein n=1 Tax=Streptomyces sp. NA04227 TaxID=2742136 RepID=UPI0015922828|nr:hypothetical protein [Streptomyces sp. NA04227]QKW08061.1 hypothetical protein HUT18_18415 [Streptomyces sp. NA04227]
MSVPPRREVHEIRAERTLPLPASLVDLAELLDVVRGELGSAGQPATDAVLRVHGRALTVAYVVPEQPKQAPKAVGFQ